MRQRGAGGDYQENSPDKGGLEEELQVTLQVLLLSSKRLLSLGRSQYVLC